MTDAILAIDAGGTFFKYALVSEAGQVLTDVFKIPVLSNGTKESILNCYKSVISHVKEIRENNIVGIGVSTPGPFDYDTGTSYMKHKFSALYGIPLKQEIKEYCNIDVPIWFCSDTNSFLAGEFEYGSGKNYSNLFGVTIGTGLGLAIVLDKKLYTNEKKGPAEVIYNMECRDKILEDFVSGRGIASYYKSISNNNSDLSAKEVSELAKTDIKAVEAFDTIGFLLGDALKGKIKKYAAEALIVGGQVAYSFELMKDGIKRGLGDVKCDVLRAENIDIAALMGLLVLREK